MQTSRAPGESPFAELALHDAHGIVDRNGDGRIDHWLFRENGRLVREVLDDNFDGQGERTIHYDIASNQVTRIEEDFNHDTVIDSWTNYRDGRVIRRRSDVDHDGAVDSWTYYRDGEISRHERDTTGDGFRDRVGYYRNGTLDHEEQDHDGDGRAEVTVRYDANEQIVGREEDLDGDSVVDLISHFENGKLTSRELLDPSALERRTAPRR
jgi:antitoxin component YwqK of YwqJK toxin-antitoxin module